MQCNNGRYYFLFFHGDMKLHEQGHISDGRRELIPTVLKITSLIYKVSSC